MNHDPHYLETMEVLSPLFRKVGKFRQWQSEFLCDWIAYFWNRGTISFVIDEHGGHGVSTIKLFSRLEQFLEPFVHEPQGGFCMIEVMVADSPAVMGRLCSEMVQRWGPGRVILWDRSERTESGAPRMFRWHEFEKLANRITKKGIDYGL